MPGLGTRFEDGALAWDGWNALQAGTPRDGPGDVHWAAEVLAAQSALALPGTDGQDTGRARDVGNGDRSGREVPERDRDWAGLERRRGPCGADGYDSIALKVRDDLPEGRGAIGTRWHEVPLPPAAREDQDDKKGD